MCAVTDRRLAKPHRNADKPPMARSKNERSNLRQLVNALARRFAAKEAEWATLIDPRVLRRFRRELNDLSERLTGNAAPNDAEATATLDRARSVCAELMVAARILDAGCEVEHEAETPSGRHVDFRARKNGVVLNVHVKRAPQPTLRDAEAIVPMAWRVLEKVHRGLVVALALSRNLHGRAMQAALGEAFAFVEQASVGDELAFRDAEARTAARLRAIAPSPTGFVELVADLSASFDSHVPRFQSTLRKAFAQFMPRSENVIVVCGSTGGIEAFATALLGSNIERWDKRPRVGELVAYGRGGDGFWAGSMRNQSRLAVYWTIAKGSGPLLFVREMSSARSGPRPPSDRSKLAIALAREIFA